MQKHVSLVDLVKSFPTNIYLQNLAAIQKRTSPVKFAHLDEKSGKGSISNLSTKEARAVRYHQRCTQVDAQLMPKLKGSIGEGSNHSNFSHQSSVKILSKFNCLLYTSPSPRDATLSRMPSSA